MTPSPAPSQGSSHFLTLISDNIVPGIIVTVVGGLILAAILNKRFRSWLWRVIKWPFTIRVTTSRRLRAREQRGWERRQAELDAERATPLPWPRWSVASERGAGPNQYLLANAAEDAVAYDIELHTSDDFFQFHDAARWKGIEGSGMFEFKGQRTNRGALFGVPFIVTWRDANGDRQRWDLKLEESSF